LTCIFNLLENEAHMLASDAWRSDIALAAQAPSSKGSGNPCTNCKKLGHNAVYCIVPSGGMASKNIQEAKDVQKKAKEARQVKNQSNSPGASAAGIKYAVNIASIDGKIYTAYMDSPLPTGTPPIPMQCSLLNLHQLTLPLSHCQMSLRMSQSMPVAWLLMMTCIPQWTGQLHCQQHM
jgi:hypothetical protein